MGSGRRSWRMREGVSDADVFGEGLKDGGSD